MVESAFEPFLYPGDERPAGEIQTSVSPTTRDLINQASSDVRAELISLGHDGDCIWEAIWWRRQLEPDIIVERVGGDGIDDPLAGSDYRFVPPSGYRESDGEVHRHWWLLLEEGRHVFDPTIHRQFDHKAGFAPDRYVLDGLSRLRRSRQPCPLTARHH